MKRMVLGMGISPLIDRRTGGGGPLARFYASGTILAHYSTDRVTRDGSGNITGFQNLGGAGAALDATVTGPALAQQGSTAVFPSGGTSFGETPAPLELVGVRLMWIAAIPNRLSQMRLFGNPSPDTFIILLNDDGSQLVAQVGATTLVLAPAPNWPTALAVYELDVSATQFRFFINGTQVSAVNHSFASVPLSTFGAANNTGQNFVGRMGEILGVNTAAADATAAITAARQRLQARVAQG